MTDRIWYVSKDEGDATLPVMAYPDEDMAKLAAVVANAGHDWLQYSAESIPCTSALPRIEQVLELETFVLADGTTRDLVGEKPLRERSSTAVHFDPTEPDEAPSLQQRYNRAFASGPAHPRPRTPAVQVAVRGTDFKRVRYTFQYCIDQVRAEWPGESWAVMYDVLDDTSAKRRRTRPFHTKLAALGWLREEWKAERVGAVQIEGWPTGEVLAGAHLDAQLAAEVPS